MAVVTALVRVALPSSAVTPALPQVLIDWINDVLVEERIIVKQLEEDLYDGQVLQKLLGESTGGAAPPAPCKGPVQGHLRPGHTVLYLATSVTHPESRLEAPVLSPQLPGGAPGPWASGHLSCRHFSGGRSTRAPSHGWQQVPHSFQDVHTCCAVGRTRPRGVWTGVHGAPFPLGCPPCQPAPVPRPR